MKYLAMVALTFAIRKLIWNPRLDRKPVVADWLVALFELGCSAILAIVIVNGYLPG